MNIGDTRKASLVLLAAPLMLCGFARAEESSFGLSMHNATHLPTEWFSCETTDDCGLVHVPCTTSLAVAKVHQNEAQLSICRAQGDCNDACRQRPPHTSSAVCVSGQCVTVGAQNPSGARAKSDSSVDPGSGTGGITITGVTGTTSYQGPGELAVTHVNGAAVIQGPSLAPLSSAAAPGPEDSLMLAVRSGNSAAVLAALETGVDVNAQDKEGHTALMFSVMYGFAKPDIVNALLSHGARLNMQAHDGMTALMLGCGSGSGGVSAEIVKTLLRHGADPNLRNSFGATALMYAAYRLEIVQALLDGGANPDVRNVAGETVLLQAVKAGRADVVSALLKKDADVTVARAADGLTAIELATKMGFTDIASMLEANGARLPAPHQWLTYENVQYKYRISYPRGGRIQSIELGRTGNSVPTRLNEGAFIVIVLPAEEYTSDQGLSTPTVVNDSYSVRIRAEGNPGGLTARKWLMMQPESRSLVIGKEVPLRGLPAISVQSPGAAGETSCIYVAAAWMYSICMDPPDPSMPQNVRDSMHDVLQRMVQSFEPTQAQ